MRSIRLGISLILILISLIMTFGILNAEEKNIKQKTIFYKNVFKKNMDYIEISNCLKSFQKYIDEALIILNKELEENKQLYTKIEKHGVFKDKRVFLNKNKDKRIDEYSQYLHDNGIKIGYSEGSIYLYFDPMYIAINFKDVLPDNIIEYYLIESEDIKEGFEEDGALTIPWDYIRKKIVRYEGYFNEISKINCPYIGKLTKEKINLYLNAYIKGLPNSPINYYITEAKSSYEKFLSENKSSIFYEIVKIYYLDLKRNGFKFGIKEEMIEGNQYIGFTILDENNKKVYINNIADKYLKQAKKLLERNKIDAK